MVKWGTLDLPELEHRPRIGFVPANWPEKPGIVHLPTGLRLDNSSGPGDERGEYRHFLLHAAPGEDWLVRIILAGPHRIENSVNLHHGGNRPGIFGWPAVKRHAAVLNYLRRYGYTLSCSSVRPEPGFDMPAWPEGRREALLLLLFWLTENSGSVAPHNPFPSTITFSGDVPDALRGTFKSPAWQRRGMAG